MRAVVKTQRGDGRIEPLNVDEPNPKAGWVVLEVAPMDTVNVRTRVRERVPR